MPRSKELLSHYHMKQEEERTVDTNTDEVILHWVPLQDEPFLAFVSAILSCPKVLQLSLYSNALGVTRGKAFARIIPQLRRLRNLAISDNELEEATIDIVASVIVHGRIESLSLIKNGMNHEIALQFGAHCQYLSQLKSLLLSKNNLGDEGMISICQGLVNGNASLYQLGLSNCGFGRKGLIALRRFVSLSTQLTELDISHNSFDDSVTDILECLLKENKSLFVINASFNPFRVFSLQRLCEAASFHPFLEHLDLSYCLDEANSSHPFLDDLDRISHRNRIGHFHLISYARILLCLVRAHHSALHGLPTELLYLILSYICPDYPLDLIYAILDTMGGFSLPHMPYTPSSLPSTSP